MTDSATVQSVHRQRLGRIADGLAVLLAISLPWSTSAASIAAALYVIAALAILDARSMPTVKTTPAVWLPIALFGLGVVGMLWADVPWAERFGALESMVKLLVLPIAMLHFRQTGRAHWAIAAFLASCAVLLAASLLPIVIPPLRSMWWRTLPAGPEMIPQPVYGVPVKDYIVQSGEFLIGMFAALYLAVDCLKAGRRLAALGLASLAALFLVDILYVVTGRTALATLPVLALLFGLRVFHWKGLAGAVGIGLLAGLLAWFSSPYLRERTMSAIDEVHRYQSDDTNTPAGERLEFWRKSLRFIVEAPVLGHGTGSIEGQFRKAKVGDTGMASLVTPNPHNQTLAYGVQFGTVGIVLLWAMWIAHLSLFRRNGFVAWFGLLVAVQAVVGSLFNSSLADFTSGWMYVMCVGAAGGAVLCAKKQPA